jgi:phospholipid/cholesterol/gamma-HCH transport system substrate-binding protein
MADENVIRREKTELLVGLFILVGMAIMGALIWQFGKISDRLGERYQISLRLDDASGIVEGSSVRFGGTKIGFVQKKDPRMDFSGIVLTLDLDSTYRIPKGSKFTVTTSGLMGDRYISVAPPSTPTPDKIEPGALVEGFVDDPVKEIQASVMDLSTRANVVLAELDQAITDSQVVVANFTKISEKINDQMLSDANLDNFANALDKISLTTDNLNKASAKLEPLIEDSRTTVKNANKPFETADKAMADLKPTIEELHTAVKRAESTLALANKAIQEITHGNGTMAALISNKDMARDLESFSANMEKYGILGYKRGKKKEDAYQERLAEQECKRSGGSARPEPAAKNQSGSNWLRTLLHPSSGNSSADRDCLPANQKMFGKTQR